MIFKKSWTVAFDNSNPLSGWLPNQRPPRGAQSRYVACEFQFTHRGRHEECAQRIGADPHSLEALKPILVGRLAGHLSVVVGGTVGPPDRATLTEGYFSRIDLGAKTLTLFGSLVGGASEGAPSIHKLLNELALALLGKTRVGATPQPATDDKVSAIRRNRVAH